MEFSGRLSAFPIGDLLQWAQNEQRTGALVIRRSGREKRIYFQGGDVVSCYSSEAAEFFGQHLLVGGLIDEMALVRALARSDVKDLTVVTYGGPDLGLLCEAGKVAKAYYGFVSLDSAPFYDPWFAKARTAGAITVREMDEGMIKCGLEAAAARLPFLPIRAGLGSDVPNFWDGELKTVVSPYADSDGRTQTLIAMPALRLDAAFVHLDLSLIHISEPTRPY